VFTVRNRGKSVVLILFLMILGVGIGYSYAYLTDRLREDNSENDKLQMNNAELLSNSMENIALKNQMNNRAELTTAETLFIFRRHYRLCKHNIVHERYATMEEIGLSEEEVQLLHPEWSVQAFSPARVLLIRELDGYCPDHYLIKEKDGYIAVYQSIENGEGVLLLCQTQMNVAFLEAGIRNRVKEGIVVDSLEEVEHLIESWDS